MKNKPFENWERTEILESVSIPTVDGKSVAETVQVKVRAWRNLSFTGIAERQRVSRDRVRI